MSAFRALTYLSVLGAVVLLWDALRSPKKRGHRG